MAGAAGKKRKSGAKRRRRKLAQRHVRISPAPGAAPQPVPALAALKTADEHRIAERFELAGYLCEQLVRDGTAAREALYIMLRAALDLRRAREALELAEQLLEGPLPDAHITGVVAEALRFCGRQERAIGLLTDALEHYPQDHDLREQRAMLYADVNRFDEAIAELDAIAAAAPGRLTTYIRKSLFTDIDDEELARLQKGPVPPGEEIDVAFGLARAWRRRGDIDREFHYLDIGNRLLAETDAWDSGAVARETSRLLDIFDREFLAEHESLRLDDVDFGRRPIFVFGMPRSGSTLIEQILVSCDGVGTAGETHAFETAIADYSRRRYPGVVWPEILLKLDRPDLEAIGRKYCDDVEMLYTDARIFVDKTLMFFRYLGVMGLIFPDARFIHACRHPLGTILSCYQQYFRSMPFSRSLERLALAYNDHTVQMNHWKTLFGDRILTVQYEELVAEPEPQMRRLLEFCGLPWTDRVLEFHRTDRAVRTASLQQVRQPMYTAAAGRWRKYEKHLEPARRILGL